MLENTQLLLASKANSLILKKLHPLSHPHVTCCDLADILD